MDKISAASAMSWCIELEKGLRSKKPGVVESIHQIGSRLKRWSEDSQLTIPMCDMFGLALGEDMLFADSILLRLVDAFVSGDKPLRTCVIKVFLSIRRLSKTKDGQAHGIFSKMSLENKLEILRRVKVLLSDECIESRALTLVLLGCCADIAKDVAEIRYAVLSSLISCHILEVKASLFAAGCFSEVSDDFGSVFLERLVNIMASPKTSLSLKIAGARAFSKIECSSLNAIKSYKVGAELARKISEEGILVALVISLTKLSSKACILVSEQVDLLSSLIAQQTSLLMQATVLRCMRYVGERAACLVPVNDFPVEALFRLFYEPNVSSAMRCDILHILLKISAYGLPGMPDINEFMKLMRCVEDSTRSSSLSERLSAFEVLIHVSNKLKGRLEVMFEGSAMTFLSRIVSALGDQVTQLLSLVPDDAEKTVIGQELRSILDLLLVLAENHSDLGYIILNNLYSVIENIVNSSTLPAVASAHQVVNAGAEKHTFSVRKLMFYIYRFLDTFLEIWDGAFRATDQVVCKLTHIVSFVCGNSLFDCSIHTFYALLLHPRAKFGCLLSENRDIGDSVEEKRRSRELVGEVFIHECVGNMVAGGDTWYAYRAGRYALSEGLPSVANSIFQQLESRVQSDFCCQWLKFLVQFSHSERNIQVLLRQACHAWPPGHVLRPLVDNDCRDINSCGCIGKLADACDDISASDKMLEAISMQTQTLCFQRWFTSLRMKIVLVLIDILKLLDTCLQCKDSVESIDLIGGSDIPDDCPLIQNIKNMMSSLVGVSSRLTRLAQECDLVSSSFIDMDSKSLRVISSLAFGCSLLAFCAEFVNSITDSLLFQNPTEHSSDLIRCHVLVRDLVGRLWHADPETCVDLMSLSKGHEVHGSYLHLLSRFHISKAGCISEELFTACRHSLKEIIGLLNKCLSIQNKGILLQMFKDSVRLLLNVLAAWMHMPFRVPKYFFRVRPSTGSMLICSNAGSGKQNELSVCLGSHLAINLCIQLKNMPSDICSSFSKIYCILHCRTSSLVSRPNAGLSEAAMTGYNASKTEMMIHLNKKLQFYVMKQTRDFMRYGDCHGDDGGVEACVCFQMNGRGQGFSNCLLDVSAFPVGSYRVEWHSGGVDSEGNYWSILPLSPGPLFNVKLSSSLR